MTIAETSTEPSALGIFWMLVILGKVRDGFVDS